MQVAHKIQGENVYELNSELKRRFDDYFQALRGCYPKLTIMVVPLDTEKDHVLSDFSGVLMKYEIRFHQNMQWKEKDQIYEITGYIDCSQMSPKVQLISRNIKGAVFKRNKNDCKIMTQVRWEDFEREYGYTKTMELGEKLETFSYCPQSEEQLGEVWLPFSEKEDIYTAGVAYNNYCCEKMMSFDIAECGCPSMRTLFDNNQASEITYIYQGIIAGKTKEEHFLDSGCSAMFFFDKEWKPTVEISRSKILGLPLKVLVAICGILNKYGMLDELGKYICSLKGWEKVSLCRWREVRIPSLNQWMNRNQRSYFEESWHFKREGE